MTVQCSSLVGSIIPISLPLTGSPGPGHFAIISAIPLAEVKPALKPGDYVLKMKIVDTVSKQSYTVEQSFKISG